VAAVAVATVAAAAAALVVVVAAAAALVEVTAAVVAPEPAVAVHAWNLRFVYTVAAVRPLRRRPRTVTRAPISSRRTSR